MSVEKIIRMFDNPATIGEPLIEAAKLQFSGEHKVRFELKRLRYIDGLRDHERPGWVGEMKNLLSLYQLTRTEHTVGTPNSAHRHEYITDVFVSYSIKDRARVGPLVSKLLEYGWTVFWDLEIPPGETWRGYIKKRLDESRCVLVVWSHESISSEWVIAEADDAKDRGVLVPVLLDRVKPPFGFTHIQAADLTDWRENTAHPKFIQCVQSVRSKLSPSAERRGTENPSMSPVLRPQVPQDFVYIPAGDFTMGSPSGEPERSDDEAEHQVWLSEFYISRYAVTVADFQQFIDETGCRTDAEKGDGSYLWDGKEWGKKAGIHWRHGVAGKERSSAEQHHPVLHVSWNDAVAYCKWRTDKTGHSFRLPTEAEWEYACRAGTTTPFNTGDNLTTAQANYNGNYPYNNNQKGVYRENTVPVDTFTPNAWGLYQMHGNVWEWCGDWYGKDYYEECKGKGIVENPVGAAIGSDRVLRGGSWSYYAKYCQSAFRSYYTPEDRSNHVGFRLVFVP